MRVCVCAVTASLTSADIIIIALCHIAPFNDCYSFLVNEQHPHYSPEQSSGSDIMNQW